MSIFPDFQTFSRHWEQADLVPVFRRVLCDDLTPVSAFRRIDSGECSFLFESVIGGERVGRYSFLTSNPFMQLVAKGKSVVLHTQSGTETLISDDPLEELKRLVQSFRVAAVDHLPPFCGGAVGYAGYDTVRYVERLPNPPIDDRGLPDLAFAFYDHMVIFDNVAKTMHVVALARGDKFRGQPRQAYEDACRRVDELINKLSTPTAENSLQDINPAGNPELAYTSNFKQQDFEAAVNRCLEYIRAGDVFQVVISQRLRTQHKVPPFEIYRTLRVVNPSPFMFYLRTPETTLVGASPEVMVRVMDGMVTVRPLAGTRPRGASDAEDKRLASELLEDPKERAEHVMLVDLGRNDVGRVADFGSVQVSDLMVVERYSHVMHITSNVSGRLAEGKDAFDALRACLPAGTVSGAPKVRAMEIIDELEPQIRGPYAGAVGYVDFSGNMDTCIALRTIVIQGEYAYVQAGAGIVADSLPESEFQETLNKARGLLRAIELTQNRCLGIPERP